MYNCNNIPQRRKKGGGYVLNDYDSRPGKIVKMLKHPLSPSKAGLFVRAHEEYVRNLDMAITVQPTQIFKKEEGGMFRIMAVQDDLNLAGGCVARDFLSNGAGSAGRAEAVWEILGQAHKAYRHSVLLKEKGVLMGLSAHVGNWWLIPGKEPIFIDTIPPAISVDGKIDAQIMISPCLREMRLLSKVLPKQAFERLVVENVVAHHFDWQCIFADFALLTSAYLPKLKGEIYRAVKEFVSSLPPDEQRMFGRGLEKAYFEARFAVLHCLRELAKPRNGKPAHEEKPEGRLVAAGA